MACSLEEALERQAQEDLAHAHQVLFRLGLHVRTCPSATRPAVVQASPDRVEVYFHDPVTTLPPDWRGELDGHLLITSGGTAAGWHAEPPPHLSVLAPIGERDLEGQVFVDLEAQPILALVGEDQCASRVLDVAIGSLIDESSGGNPTFVVVGDRLPPQTSDHSRVDRFRSWEEAERLVTSRAIQGCQVLASHRWPSTFQARAAWPARDDLQPLVVLCDEAPPSGALEVLNRCHPTPVSVVAIGTAPRGATQIACSTDRLLLPAIGLACRATSAIAPSTPTGDEGARRSSGAAPSQAPPDTDSPPLSSVDSPPQSPDADVLVRLLGDIAIEGSQKALSAKPTALVAYIAVHRDVPTERLEAACWAKDGIDDHRRRRRLRNLMSEGRTAVGTTNLPTADDGHYRAGPRLLTDLDLFDWHVTRASYLEPADAAAAYRSALDLVTGPVFSFPSRSSDSYAWIDVENLVSHWEVRIAGVAQQCAATYLDLGRPVDAIEMLDHITKALPLHAGLVEMLMRAHARMGDRTAIQSTFTAYAKAMHDLHLEVEDSVWSLHEALAPRCTG